MSIPKHHVDRVTAELRRAAATPTLTLSEDQAKRLRNLLNSVDDGCRCKFDHKCDACMARRLVGELFPVHVPGPPPPITPTRFERVTFRNAADARPENIMNITTRFEVKEVKVTNAWAGASSLDEGKAQLIIHVSVNGNETHSYVHLSGPREDIEAFVKGEIDEAEVSRRWRMAR